MQDWGPTLNTAKTTELIIFGPSAGWTLSEKFLAKFSKVICVEPDPFARLLFRLRFRKMKVEFDKRSDRLPWFAKDRSPKTIGRGTEELLAKYPNAAILFSNLLGQVQLLMEKPNASFNERAQNSLLSALAGRAWASYHDVVSTTLTPKLAPAITAINLSDLIEENFEVNEVRHVTDHETEWLGSTRTSIWQIRPGIYHLVGFTTASEHRARLDVKSTSVNLLLDKEIPSLI